MQNALFFPVREHEAVLLYKFKSDSHVVVHALLAEHGEGPYVEFGVNIDGEFSGRLAFLADYSQERNTKAEKAFTFLTDGAHFVIPGNACLVDIPPELVAYIAEGRFQEIED